MSAGRLWPGKTVIGLTGNIAVGKSAVRRMLRKLGAATIDADCVARQQLAPGGAACAPVMDEFGAGILDAHGQIDRAALGAIVFADATSLARLEALTHPAIHAEILRRVAAAERRVVVIEAIKLLESGLMDLVDTVWVVDATPATQQARLMATRGLDEATARQRIAAQNPQASKLARADVIIRNEGCLTDTERQTRAAWQALVGD